jgi:hypothetical protein
MARRLMGVTEPIDRQAEAWASVLDRLGQYAQWFRRSRFRPRACQASSGDQYEGRTIPGPEHEPLCSLILRLGGVVSSAWSAPSAGVDRRASRHRKRRRHPPTGSPAPRDALLARTGRCAASTGII